MYMDGVYGYSCPKKLNIGWTEINIWMNRFLGGSMMHRVRTQNQLGMSAAKLAARGAILVGAAGLAAGSWLFGKNILGPIFIDRPPTTSQTQPIKLLRTSTKPLAEAPMGTDSASAWVESATATEIPNRHVERLIKQLDDEAPDLKGYRIRRFVFWLAVADHAGRERIKLGGLDGSDYATHDIYVSGSLFWEAQRRMNAILYMGYKEGRANRAPLSDPFISVGTVTVKTLSVSFTPKFSPVDEAILVLDRLSKQGLHVDTSLVDILGGAGGASILEATWAGKIMARLFCVGSDDGLAGRYFANLAQNEMRMESPHYVIEVADALESGARALKTGWRSKEALAMARTLHDSVSGAE